MRYVLYNPRPEVIDSNYLSDTSSKNNIASELRRNWQTTAMSLRCIPPLKSIPPGVLLQRGSSTVLCSSNRP